MSALGALRTMPDITWQARAACRGAADTFFPPDDLEMTDLLAAIERAKDICSACPVQEDCRHWALLERSPLVGCVVAGMSTDQLAVARRDYADERRSLQRPKCGTSRGYDFHREHDEECAICLDYHKRRSSP